jgi:glyoxylase-like metal-dependent hydrolase (beta-lactamase superfamily II)
MDIQKVGKRSMIFTYSFPKWDLNLHLIEAEKYNYVIDTGLGDLSVEPIKKQIEASGKPVIVINTHYHWDHIWGNCAFENSVIISHRLCREIITAKWDDMLSQYSRHIYGEVEKSLPNITFDSEIYFPDDGIRIIYTPGHTEDCISVLDERDGVLNAGDNIGDNMVNIVPELDCPKEIYIKTLDVYKSMDFEFCVSGHNRVLGRDIIDKIAEELKG